MSTRNEESIFSIFGIAQRLEAKYFVHFFSICSGIISVNEWAHEIQTAERELTREDIIKGNQSRDVGAYSFKNDSV